MIQGVISTRKVTTMKLTLAILVSCLMIGEVQAQYRHPRIAAMAMPGPPFTPQYAEPLSDRPLVRAMPKIVASASFATSVVPSPFSLIGTFVPMTIRFVHVLVNGSFTPGHPLKTAVWVASPYGQQYVQRFRERIQSRRR